MNFEDDIIEFLLPNSNCIHHLEKYSCLWLKLNQLGTIIVLQPWLTLILYYKVEVHFRMIEFLWNCLWKFTIFIDIFEQMEQLENICWQPAEQNKILKQFNDFFKVIIGDVQTYVFVFLYQKGTSLLPSSFGF